MVPKVERLSEIGNLELGEGPHWDAKSQSLYFVDIFKKTIHKYVPATRKHTKAQVDGGKVSLIIPVAGQPQKFLITIENKLVIITWNGESDSVSELQTIAEVDEGTENRINDGKCDPSGRLWTGTMGPEREIGHYAKEEGTLVSLDKGKVISHENKIGISNGLAWNTELKKMYYVDSLKGTVDQFDFDITKGTIANRTPIFTMSKNNIKGLPDGITIDVDGNLWVAVFNTNSVIKIDPRHPETLLETIPIPALQVTSVAFGGPNLDELYVTSGRFTVDGVVLSAPEQGAVYRVTGINAKGFPGVDFVL